MTPRRPSRRCRVISVGLAVFAMAGCGTSLHPGTAAIVNGSSIPQSRVDGLVQAACQYIQLNRIAGHTGTQPNTAMASLKSTFAQSLISFQLTDKAFSNLHLSVSDASVAKVVAAGSVQLPAGLSDTNKELLTTFFHNSAKFQLEEAVIGAHLKNPAVTNADHVQQSDQTAAAGYLHTFITHQSVSVNPSYGRWTGQAVTPGSGSLSVPVSAAAKQPFPNGSTSATDLPPSQVCG
ncbi:MAG: SurA N-terminal domain-containing protein [Nocardioidaceae bacterium]